MLNRFWQLLWLCTVMLLAVACSAGLPAEPAEEAPRTGRILLWHTWTGAEGGALDKMLARYQELNPGIEIISIGTDAAAFVDRFADRSKGGLGPDLILADAGIIYELTERDLIRDLAPLDLDLSSYLATAGAHGRR
ncbi:MAG: hypothetical protein V9G19_11215 [Tetrasphaera sp.]